MMKERLPITYTVNRSFVLACLFTSVWEGYTSTVKPPFHPTTLQSLISHLYFCLNSGHLWIPLHVWDKSEITGTADLKKETSSSLYTLNRCYQVHSCPEAGRSTLSVASALPWKEIIRRGIRNTVGRTRRVDHLSISEKGIKTLRPTATFTLITHESK